MTHVSADPADTITSDVETSEPADDNSYRVLAYSFMIGMVFIFAFFILMLILLAGAS